MKNKGRQTNSGSFTFIHSIATNSNPPVPLLTDYHLFTAAKTAGTKGKAAAADYDSDYTSYAGDYYYGGAGDEAAKACVAPEGEDGLDAFAWVKTPGESDGRMYPAGTFHPCLLSHLIECSDNCPQYVPKLSGEFQRSESCMCVDE